MRVVQVSRPGGPFEIVERTIPQPGPREVRVKVQACGLCHSDSLTKEGHFPGVTYPRVPGHEIAGVIDAVGSQVPQWKVGNALASDGWGLIVATANHAVAGFLSPVQISESRASRWMADIRSTYWFRSRDWRSFQRKSS